MYVILSDSFPSKILIPYGVERKGRAGTEGESDKSSIDEATRTYPRPRFLVIAPVHT